MSDYNANTDISEYNKLLEVCYSNRQRAYMEQLGNWQDQLDMIFHNFDGWKQKIQEIKNEFPKPSAN